MDKNKKFHQNTDLDATRKTIETESGRDTVEAFVDPNYETLPDIEDEIGMTEVDMDEEAIDSLPADTSDDNLDTNDDGIVDTADDQGRISDLPQPMTESYGTGLQGRPSDRTGSYSRRSEHHLHNDPDMAIVGGDVDANFEQASVVGEEAVGGTTPTPDQDVVDDLAAAVGIETDDRSFLRTNDMLNDRDDRRWELDPKSSEDYSQRRE